MLKMRHLAELFHVRVKRLLAKFFCISLHFLMKMIRHGATVPCETFVLKNYSNL